MLAPAQEDFLTVYLDPGEDFGWCVGRGMDLLAAGTHRMWTFADFLWEKLNNPAGLAASGVDDGTGPDEANPLSSDSHIRVGVDPTWMQLPIGRIVCEDFVIYPWEAHKGSLDWNPVRTARVIGAISFMARLHSIPMTLQGADTKEAALAAGAEEYFYKPLRPNRHQNDAIMHFVFFTNVELLGSPLPIPASVRKEELI